MDEDDDYSDDGPTTKKRKQKRKLDDEEEEEETDEDEGEDEDSDNDGLFSSDDEAEEEDQIEGGDSEDDLASVKNSDDISTIEDEEDEEEVDEETRRKRLAKRIKETQAAASAAAASKKKKTKKKKKTTEPKAKRPRKSRPQKKIGILITKTKALTSSREKDVAIAVESLLICKRDEEEKATQMANKELVAKRAEKQKRMKEQRARAIKGANCFPRESIGYNPDIENVFIERERRHASQGIARIAAEAIKHLDVTKTRFVPCNNNANEMNFYQKPCSLCCLWCTESFDNPPFPLPRRVSPIKCDKITFLGPERHTVMLSDQRAVSFHVTGQYCSPSCVLAAADECSRLNGMKSLKPLVFYMLRHAYNMPSKTDIVQAPDRRMLKKYGGIMDINAFRATGAVGINTTTVEMPLVPFYAGIEEVEKIKFCVRETLDPGGVVDYVVKVVHSIGAQALTTRNAYQHQQNPRENKKQVDFRGCNRPSIPSTSVSTSSTNRLFSAMPTIAQQLALSERMMVLEKEAVGDKTGNVKKKTLKDFMLLEPRPLNLLKK